MAAPAEPARVVDPGPVTPGPSFSRLFFEEMFRNLVVASVVLACVVAATLVGLAVEDDWGPITGAVLGLGVGLARRPAVPRPTADLSRVHARLCA